MVSTEMAWRATSPFGESTRRYANENGLTVKRGPFEGMIYTDGAIGKANHLSSKPIGSYEPAAANFLGERAAGPTNSSSTSVPARASSAWGWLAWLR